MNQSRKNADTTTAAQKHLQAISDVLLSTSPHASAFLAHQLQQSKLPPTPSSHPNAVPDNCRACGNALIPGWSCTVSQRRLPEISKKSKTKSKAAKKPAIPRITYIDFKCTLCNSVNTVKSDTQAPARRSKSNKSLLESKPTIATMPVQIQTTTSTKPIAITTATPSPAPSAAVSSSSEQTRGAADKKRNRKQKLGGLQAMLAKSKAPSTATKAFDFMDFMKTT
jgi:phage FluMu protein Com